MSNKEDERAIIIDGMNAFVRSFAIDPSVAEDGSHIGGLMGFMKQLQRYVREMKPTRIIVAWDGSGGSKRRRNINKNYKKGRKKVISEGYNRNVEQPMSEEEAERNKQWQLIRLMEYLSIFPVRQFIFEHVEADDIIAAAVQSSALKGMQKIIISNDKDFVQLLNDETVLYRPTQKVYLNYKGALEKYGIHPNNMALARAIVGDKSDNLPGISGVGLKTAVKCFPELSESNSMMLTEVFEKCKKNSEQLKAYRDILAGKDKVKENYDIMQLYTPKISYDAVRQIEKEIKYYSDVGFQKTEFRNMLTEDGFPSYNWSDMKIHFRKLLYKSINNVFEE